MSTTDLRWLMAQAVAKLPAGRVLFVEAAEIALQIASERPDITPVVFSTLKEPWLKGAVGKISGVMLGWSHHKEQVRMQLAMLAEKMPVGTRLWMYGAGRSGISSAPGVLGRYWSKPQKVAYGGHGELWFAELLEEAPPRGIDAWQNRFIEDVAGETLVLISLPGVFSHGEVDKGTRLLLEHLPKFAKGAKVHDFGCGCGIIASWLKVRQPEITVSASDINALAWKAAHATLKANKITDVVVHVAAGLKPIPGPLDAIVTNPPFHTGQKLDRKITDELFATARSKLRRGGAMYVVANRFLPYREIMEEQIGPTEVLADTPQFWVLKATAR